MEDLAAIEEQKTLALTAPKNWKLFIFPNVNQFKNEFDNDDGTTPFSKLREKTLRFASAVYGKFELTFERIEIYEGATRVSDGHVLMYVNDLVFKIETRYVYSGTTIVYEDKFYTDGDVCLFEQLCLEEVA